MKKATITPLVFVTHVSREQSVELGAHDGGCCCGAVPCLKLERQQQQQQHAAHILAGGDSGCGFSCW